MGVTIGSNDLSRHRKVYTAITSLVPVAEPSSSRPLVGDGSGGPGEQPVAFALGDARVVLVPSATVGLRQLCISVANVGAAAKRLQTAGATFGCRNGQIIVDRTWSAVQVALVEQPLGPELSHPTDVTLDHVAVLVTDITTMAQRWTVLLGIDPNHVGMHPLGTSRTARFLLGSRMIEVLSPCEGKAPLLHERLRRAGDGPFALALIGPNAEATRTAVVAAGARVLRQPPHLIVHPVDAAGVPVQITPRMHH